MSLARTLVTILGLCLTSCSSTMPAASKPEIRQLRVEDHPDHAYHRALHAAFRMGASITQQHSQTRFLSAQLHNAVVRNVLVTPKGQGALVDVQGMVLPNKVVFGAFTDVDDFLAAFQRHE
ncbi:MAG TPA: hypothetical protein VES36_03720 [Candidatus Limnocylindrales bacterium]|nr:hypothetical protein [Candidatus Limnocylindrales bacterium]